MSLPKITPPALPRGAIPTRLGSWLRQSLAEAQAAWISGPPGSGKSTQLALLAAGTGSRLIWYQLDERDGELETFLYYLGAAAAAGGWGRVDLPRLSPHATQRHRVAHLRRTVEALAAAAEGPFILIFDDHHELRPGSELQDLFPVLVATLPADARVVIASRGSPPRTFARLRIQGRLAEADWDLLRLTADEAALLVRRRQPALSEDAVRRVVGEADGFAAGLAVLADAAARRPRTAGRGDGIELLFDYFAAEFFDSLGPESREVLLAACLLPHGTSEMVDRMVGSSGSGPVLEALSHGATFVTRHAGTEAVYRIHPLFRRFLISRAREELGPVEFDRRRAQAARILGEVGQVESAVALLLELGDYEEIEKLVVHHAVPYLLAGRHAEVEAWLTPVPEAEFRERPWMLYWLGASRLPRKGGAGRAALARAFEWFMEQGNAEGAYASFIGTANSFIAEMGRFEELRRWLERTEELRAAFPDYPNRETEIDFTATVIGGLLLADPDRRRLSPFVRRGHQLLREEMDPGRRLVLAYALYEHALQLGSFHDAQKLARIPLRGVERAGAPALLLGFLEHFATMVLWQAGRPEEALRYMARGLAAAEEAGASTHHLLTNGIHAAVLAGDLDGAEALLGELAARLDPRGLIHAQQCAAHFAVLSLRRGRLDEAERRVREALALSREAGAPIFEAYDHLGLGIVLAKRGRLDEARREVGVALGFAERLGSAWLEAAGALYGGWIEARLGGRESAFALLRRGLAHVREQGYAAFLIWVVPDVLAETVDLALRGRVEPEAARHLIDALRLDPPPGAGPDWPWRVRVEALGRLRVTTQASGEIDLGGARRLRQLLAVLAAAPRGRMGQSAVEDALWPEAQGDSARRAFDTALHRLRRRLGDPAAVILEAGELRLHPGRCFVDVVAFEEAARRLLSDRSASADAAVEGFEDLLRLYRGPLLAGEEELPVEGDRRRVRRLLERATRRVRDLLEAEGRREDAERLLDRVLERDPACRVRAAGSE